MRSPQISPLVRTLTEGWRYVCDGLHQMFEYAKKTNPGSLGLNDQGRIRRRYQKDDEEAQDAWISFEWRPELYDGEGGCIQHYADWFSDVTLSTTHPQCYETWDHEDGWTEEDWLAEQAYDWPTCNALRVPSASMCFNFLGTQNAELKFYRQSRRWIPGILNSETECEVASCYPDFWITTPEKCETGGYCQDGWCQKCEPDRADAPMYMIGPRHALTSGAMRRSHALPRGPGFDHIFVPLLTRMVVSLRKNGVKAHSPEHFIISGRSLCAE